MLTYDEPSRSSDAPVGAGEAQAARWAPRERSAVVRRPHGFGRWPRPRPTLARRRRLRPAVPAAAVRRQESINVLMVNNPPMLELQKLTAANFTKDTGIKVNFVPKVEQDMRDTASTEFANQSGQYDVATLSNFEIPYYAKAGWISDMQSIANDATFDQADILPSMTAALSYNGKVYGEPFYGESSFLMYRKDVLAAKGITMPANPTWQQVADAAAKVDGAKPGMKGICLRGLAGWGDNLAPLTTVVNTMGGTWFDENWKAQVNTGGFKTAANFYVNLIHQHGEAGAATFSFPQCLAALQQGKVAMWYDSTAAAGLARGVRLAGQGQDRLRRGAARPDRQRGLALHLGVGDREGVEAPGRRGEVRRLGVQQGLRAAGRERHRERGHRWSDQHPGRQAGLDVLRPDVPQGRELVRDADAGLDQERAGGQPGRPEAAVQRHPVRRDPVVHRLRPDLRQGHQQCDRRLAEHRRRAERVPVRGAGRRRQAEGLAARCVDSR